jgi:hypothetical protein
MDCGSVVVEVMRKEDIQGVRNEWDLNFRSLTRGKRRGTSIFVVDCSVVPGGGKMMGGGLVWSALAERSGGRKLEMQVCGESVLWEREIGRSSSFGEAWPRGANLAGVVAVFTGR